MNDRCVCMHWLRDPLSSHCCLTFTLCSFIRDFAFSIGLNSSGSNGTVSVTWCSACMHALEPGEKRKDSQTCFLILPSLAAGISFSPLFHSRRIGIPCQIEQIFSWSQRLVVWQLCLCTTIWTCASIPAEWRRRRWWKNFQVEPQSGRRQELWFLIQEQEREKEKEERRCSEGGKRGGWEVGGGKDCVCEWMYMRWSFPLSPSTSFFFIPSEQQLLAITFCICYFTITLWLPVGCSCCPFYLFSPLFPVSQFYLWNFEVTAAPAFFFPHRTRKCALDQSIQKISSADQTTKQDGKEMKNRAIIRVNSNSVLIKHLWHDFLNRKQNIFPPIYATKNMILTWIWICTQLRLLINISAFRTCVQTSNRNSRCRNSRTESKREDKEDTIALCPPHHINITVSPAVKVQHRPHHLSVTQTAFPAATATANHLKVDWIPIPVHPAVVFQESVPVLLLLSSFSYSCYHSSCCTTFHRTSDQLFRSTSCSDKQHLIVTFTTIVIWKRHSTVRWRLESSHWFFRMIQW